MAGLKDIIPDGMGLPFASGAVAGWVLHSTFGWFEDGTVSAAFVGVVAELGYRGLREVLVLLAAKRRAKEESDLTERRVAFIKKVIDGGTQKNLSLEFDSLVQCYAEGVISRVDYEREVAAISKRLVDGRMLVFSGVTPKEHKEAS